MAKQKLNIQKQGFPSVSDAYNDILGISIKAITNM